MTENVNKKKKSTYYLALIFRPDPGDTTVASLNGIKPYRGPTASLPYIATDSLFALPLMDNTQYRHRLVTVAARLQSWLAQAAALRREREWERGLNPTAARTGLKFWAWFARRPALYHLATWLAFPLLAVAGGRKRRFGFLPLAGGWVRHRDMPAPQGRTFMQQWRDRDALKQGSPL